MADMVHYGMVAEYEGPAELMHAAEKARDAGFANFDCHSPFPIHGMDKAMGLGQSKLGWLVLGGGLTGLLTAMLLQGWTSVVEYPLVISGKNLFSYQAFVPIAFELTILFSAFGAVFGMFAINKLPMLFHHLFYSRRFREVTNDSFFMSIDATDLKYDREHTRAFLEKTHPKNIEEIEGERTCVDDLIDQVKELKGKLAPFLPILVCFLLIGCYQGRPSKEPPIHLNPNMDVQPKYKPQRSSKFFANDSAQRMPVAGTVARGQLQESDVYYKGKTAAGRLVRNNPVSLSADVMQRGRERYQIYCTPCHGKVGDGRGIVPKRGYPLPSSFHTDLLRNREDGHIFDVISNGLNNMPSYGTQIPVQDRWAIVHYLRALQRSQYATLKDVPEEKRQELLVEAPGQKAERE